MPCHALVLSASNVNQFTSPCFMDMGRKCLVYFMFMDMGRDHYVYFMFFYDQIPLSLLMFMNIVSTDKVNFVDMAKTGLIYLMFMDMVMTNQLGLLNVHGYGSDQSVRSIECSWIW